MALTTSQAMAAFMEQITATEYQKKSIITGRQDRVVQNLTAAFPATSDMPFSVGLLMGSGAKGTITRPFDDVDVMAVFANKNDIFERYRYDSKAFLYRVRRAYDGIETKSVGARGQAVRIFFDGGGHVDVAPMFPYGNDVYALPNGVGGWLRTAPTLGGAWFAKKNADLSYNLAPLVRLLKRWNAAHSKRLRSFHLETMAGSAFSKLGSNRQSALENFFEWAPSRLDVDDPGGQSGNLADYLNWTERKDVEAAFASAADRARRARAAKARFEHEEAKRLWRIVLGSDFPN